jgi:hypothetical protein
LRVVCDGCLEAHRLTLDRPDYPMRTLVNPIAFVKAQGDLVEPLLV